MMRKIFAVAIVTFVSLDAANVPCAIDTGWNLNVCLWTAGCENPPTWRWYPVVQDRVLWGPGGEGRTRDEYGVAVWNWRCQ